jgi:hypothetical protein
LGNLVPRREWQQGDVASLFNSARESPLVLGTHTGETARNNLASLGDKLLQQPNIAVMDRVDLLHAELADLLAPEELASTTGSARTTWSTSTWAATAGTIPRGTLWTISRRTLWTVSRRTIWTVSRRTVWAIPCWALWTIPCWTLGCGTLWRARCCCYCAGLISHGFLLLSSRPAFRIRSAE